MNDAILVCYCPGVDKKAVATYKVAAKKDTTPPVYKGRYGISDFVSILQKQGVQGEIMDYARAMSKSSEKFAYYMRWALDGKVEVQYNLLTGKRLICSKN